MMEMAHRKLSHSQPECNMLVEELGVFYIYESAFTQPQDAHNHYHKKLRKQYIISPSMGVHWIEELKISLVLLHYGIIYETFYVQIHVGGLHCNLKILPCSVPELDGSSLLCS